MQSSPDNDRQRQLADSARALPFADREAHVRRMAGNDGRLRDSVLGALAKEGGAAPAETAREGAASSTGERMQASATEDLMDRLAVSPKLDVDRYEFEG